MSKRQILKEFSFRELHELYLAERHLPLGEHAQTLRTIMLMDNSDKPHMGGKKPEQVRAHDRLIARLNRIRNALLKYWT